MYFFEFVEQLGIDYRLLRELNNPDRLTQREREQLKRRQADEVLDALYSTWEGLTDAEG